MSVWLAVALALTAGGVATRASGQQAPQLVSLAVSSNGAGGVDATVPAGSTGPWSYGNSVMQTWRANENGQSVQWRVQESYALDASILVTQNTWRITSAASFSRLALDTPAAIDFDDVSDWATVDMTVMFQLTQPTTVQYSALRFESGPFVTESRAYLNGNIGATFASNTTTELAAGTHWIRVRSTIQRSWIPDGPYVNASTGMTFVMTVPSPGVTATCMSAMILAVRRRR